MGLQIKNNSDVIAGGRNHEDTDVFVFQYIDSTPTKNRELEKPVNYPLKVGDINPKNVDWYLIKIEKYAYGTIYVWKQRRI